MNNYYEKNKQDVRRGENYDTHLPFHIFSYTKNILFIQNTVEPRLNGLRLIEFFINQTDNKN